MVDASRTTLETQPTLIKASLYQIGTGPKLLHEGPIDEHTTDMLHPLRASSKLFHRHARTVAR